MTLLEVFGYVASVLIALSLMMSNIKRLRWINLFGAMAFSCYGYFIDAYPVFLLNGWIALVDVYYLVRIYTFKDQFDLVRLTSVNTPLFTLLVSRYGEDIENLFPNFHLNELNDGVALLVFRNMKPVGLFAFRELSKQGDVEILLDYVIPDERDFKTAKYLFDRHASVLKDEGVVHLMAKPNDDAHEKYLKKIGFAKKDHAYQLTLH
jgi:hypothetical protein